MTKDLTVNSTFKLFVKFSRLSMEFLRLILQLILSVLERGLIEELCA